MPLPPAPKNVNEILDLEASLALPYFDAETAWALGYNTRRGLQEYSKRPAVVNIALANSSQVLFHAVSAAGTAPDNDTWVARKRATVLRWGNSSWWMHIKMRGDEAAFSQKYMLGDRAGDYAIHGGSVPIRVSGVEGVVAVITVSGLSQEEDHMIAVEELRRLKQTFSREHGRFGQDWSPTSSGHAASPEAW